MTENSKLRIMRYGNSWCLAPVIAACEFDELPPLTYQMLKCCIQYIVFLIHLEEGHDTIADCNTEGENPDAPIDNEGHAAALDGEKGRDNEGADCNRNTECVKRDGVAGGAVAVFAENSSQPVNDNCFLRVHKVCEFNRGHKVTNLACFVAAHLDFGVKISRTRCKRMDAFPPVTRAELKAMVSPELTAMVQKVVIYFIRKITEAVAAAAKQGRSEYEEYMGEHPKYIAEEVLAAAKKVYPDCTVTLNALGTGLKVVWA